MEKKNRYLSTFFVELWPFEIISMKIVSTLQLKLKNRQRYCGYFHEIWYKYYVSRDDMWRNKIITHLHFFAELWPFEIIGMKIVSTLQLKLKNL